MGAFSCPINKPIGNTETVQNMYEKSMARLQKIKDAAYNVSISGCEFRILLREIPGLENELCSHLYIKNSINIRDAFYGVEPRLLKQSRGRGKDPLCRSHQSTPTFVNMVNFLYINRKCGWVQIVPLTVCIGRVLSFLRFYLLGNYHRMFPYKSNSKLMLPLCSVCPDTMNRDDSTH